ncbi:MAG: motility protein A [Spirochaetes bacterium]|nr:motility protein A [Spirochaetota bacterium]
MDLATIVGVIAGFTFLVLGIIFAGGSILQFIDPASIMITFGGSAAAMFVAFPMFKIMKMLPVFRVLLFPQTYNAAELILTIVSFSEKARREGLLALEDDLTDLDDEFLRKGIQLVVDGNDQELVRKILETEIEHFLNRHDENKSFLDTWASVAPSFGMMGTLIGLVIMLANLEDRAAIGPALATALITTFYGAMLAYFLLIPMAKKLDYRTNEETLTKLIMIEGVLSIQAGENPRIVKDKLVSFLPPAQRAAISEKVGD